jgi:hypothetical protein
MATPEKKTRAFPQSLHESDRADWVDEEISSLRQAVERDASRQKAPAYDLHAEFALGPRPVTLFPSLSKARRFVRRRRFDVVFYGLCIGFTIAVVLIAVSSGAR